MLLRFKFTVVVLAMAFVFALPFAVRAEEPTPMDLGLVPVRDFFQDLGGFVSWNEEHGRIRVIFWDDVIDIFTEGIVAHVNGEPVNLNTGITMWHNMTFITRSDLQILAFTMNGQDFMSFALTEEARDLALDDFDLVVRLIRENSAWEGVLYRSLGLVFDEHVATHRELIEGMIPRNIPINDRELFHSRFPVKEGDSTRELAANYLFALLAYEFAPAFGGIGHLMPRALHLYQFQLASLLRQHYGDGGLDSELDLQLQLLLEVFTDPSAVWFYGEVEVDFEEESHPFPEVEGNIETEIIIPGEVAYLRIDSFVSNPHFDDLTILPFLQEVSDFDHIIIDLRGNAGGIATYFDEFLLRRLITESVEVSFHEFFSSGELAQRFMDAFVETAGAMVGIPGWIEVLYVDILPSADFVHEREMVYIDADDFEKLPYVVVQRFRINPAYDSIQFDGQVWLLVDGDSASASVLAAQTAFYTGFATVVGETTSGVTGAQMSYVVLPNTGIIWRIDIGYVTDAYGRSLEVYGLRPQIENFEGLDALETVLEVINTNQ